jgi:hypothetical protein
MAVKIGKGGFMIEGEDPRFNISCENGLVALAFVADDDVKAKMYMTPDTACELSDVLIRWAAYVRARFDPKKRAS